MRLSEKKKNIPLPDDFFPVSHHIPEVSLAKSALAEDKLALIRKRPSKRPWAKERL
jgi:hypothetical protein